MPITKMHLLLGSRSERGGARRAPTRRVSHNFNFFQVEEVEKFTERILLVCQNESDEYTDRCRIYVAQAIQTTAEHLIFSSHPSVMVSNS